MYLTNVAQIKYIQRLPDGSLKLVVQDSNVVTTNLKAMRIHKKFTYNYVRRRRVEANNSANYEFLILFWILKRYLMS